MSGQVSRGSAVEYQAEWGIRSRQQDAVSWGRKTQSKSLRGSLVDLGGAQEGALLWCPNEGTTRCR